MGAGFAGPGLERFRFLLGQYSQWLVSAPGLESGVVENHQLQLAPLRGGTRLSISHPRWRLQGRIAALRLEKSGRCVVRLDAGGFGGTRLVILAPREAAGLGSDAHLRREKFRKWTLAACARLFPQGRTQHRKGLAAGNQNNTANLMRLLVRTLTSRILVLALEKEAGKAGLWSALARGLSDLCALRHDCGQERPAELALVVHRSMEPALRRLLSCVDAGRVRHRTFIYQGSLRPPQPAAELKAELPSSRLSVHWPRETGYFSSPMLERVWDSYGTALRRFALPRGGTAFRFRGLDVLRLRGEDCELYFGPPDFGTRLSDSTWKRFGLLMEEVMRVRRAASREKRHPFYRWQGERWLEEVLLCDMERLDPELRAEWVYSQVPACAEEGRSVLDMLTIRRDGRLAVVELKVTRDPDFLIQALDYWDLVARLNAQGEFKRRGYFPGVEISRLKPLLYLVAPVFCFDRRLPEQAGLLEESIEIRRIAVGGQWRKELRVVDQKPLRDVN